MTTIFVMREMSGAVKDDGFEMCMKRGDFKGSGDAFINIDGYRSDSLGIKIPEWLKKNRQFVTRK